MSNLYLVTELRTGRELLCCPDGRVICDAEEGAVVNYFALTPLPESVSATLETFMPAPALPAWDLVHD